MADVIIERDVGIVAHDGARLSADVYRPALEGRHPSLLEHLPYRKDDLRAAQDRAQCLVLARGGFVCVRLDVRGTGSSEGIARDEYTEEEQADGVAAVAWMARQPWSNGRVGVWGVSYGGFTALQIAALRPPALGAICAVYATDDRWTDECHWFGGALSASELPRYPVRMLAANALPPRAGDNLLDRWRERIDATPPWILSWMREQADGPYWRNGSLAPDYARIVCPVFLVAGWRDGYRSAALRTAQRLACPWQLLAGPWAHVLPDKGAPGPPYPFLDEMMRFFRKHLASGHSDRPRTVFSVGDHWFASETWPANAQRASLSFATAGARIVDTPMTVGLTVGKWCPPANAGGLPIDPTADDARSLTFTTAPLSEPLETFGAPTLRFHVDASAGTVVAARLVDVAADGSATLVTRGISRVRSGENELTIELMATGWRFSAGHAVRVAIATSDWPGVWPLPRRTAIRVDGEIELSLPALPPDAVPYQPSGVPADLLDANGAHARVLPPEWRLVRDTVRGVAGYEGEDGVDMTLGDMFVRERRSYAGRVQDEDPLSALVKGIADIRVDRPDLHAHIRARGRFTCDVETFIVELDLDVRSTEHGLVRDVRIRERIPRRGC